MKNGLIVHGDGSKHWWVNDKLHREDGPAIQYPNGTECWYMNGKLHREDGPAIKNHGFYAWYLNDKFVCRQFDKPEKWKEMVKLAQVEMIMES